MRNSVWEPSERMDWSTSVMRARPPFWVFTRSFHARGSPFLASAVVAARPAPRVTVATGSSALTAPAGVPGTVLGAGGAATAGAAKPAINNPVRIQSTRCLVMMFLPRLFSELQLRGPGNCSGGDLFRLHYVHAIPVGSRRLPGVFQRTLQKLVRRPVVRVARGDSFELLHRLVPALAPVGSMRVVPARQQVAMLLRVLGEGEQFVNPHRLQFAFHADAVQVAAHEMLLHLLVRELADDVRGAIRLVEPFQARRQIHGVA